HHSLTTVLSTLSLHDALPISPRHRRRGAAVPRRPPPGARGAAERALLSRGLDRGQLLDSGRLPARPLYRGALSARPLVAAHSLRSEEHTSELQSLRHLVCRLL